MRIRAFAHDDVAPLTDLTIETFRPFFEEVFRPSPPPRRGTALCEHAFEQMRLRGAEIVEIGTGGDPFHAPARALYEQLGCTQNPVAVYFRQL
ncbi:hypothetical protein ACIRL3_39410 [Streptomyces sp. NPDC102384]|uniref:hypothetical protein n=1 Tax=Streptomyces sp. NPDC102384 TaxID=3366166 RepID=UPI0037F5F703